MARKGKLRLPFIVNMLNFCNTTQEICCISCGIFRSVERKTAVPCPAAAGFCASIFCFAASSGAFIPPVSGIQFFRFYRPVRLPMYQHFALEMLRTADLSMKFAGFKQFGRGWNCWIRLRIQIVIRSNFISFGSIIRSVCSADN